MQPSQNGEQIAPFQNHRPDLHHNQLNVRRRLERQPPSPLARFRPLPIHVIPGPSRRLEIPQKQPLLNHVLEPLRLNPITPTTLIPQIPQLALAPHHLLHRTKRHARQEVPSGLQIALQEKLQTQGKARRQALHVFIGVQEYMSEYGDVCEWGGGGEGCLCEFYGGDDDAGG